MFSKEFPFAFTTTIPVLLGYIAIGMAFGLMLVAAGYPWWLAPIMSVLMYAGAGQYLAVSLFVANAGWWEVALFTFLVNSRHMVYGVSLLNRFYGFGWHKLYMIFALTDETYALQTSLKEPVGLQRKQVYFYIALLDHLYWILGGLLGAVAGSLLPIPTKGIGFALTALFMVLVIEQWRQT